MSDRAEKAESTLSDRSREAVVKELCERITNYLASGGLFNPEAMEHDKVRDLLIACRDALSTLNLEPKTLAGEDIADQLASTYPGDPDGSIRAEPSPVQGVTDAMVERAKEAVWNTDAPEYKRDYLVHDHIMRAALEAALSSPAEAVPVAWLKEWTVIEASHARRRSRVDLKPGAEAWMEEFSETPLYATPSRTGAAEAVEALRHAIATMSNDDYSAPGTRERQRHVERLTAMQKAIDVLSPTSGEPSA